ncbi:hypothetical protein T459_16452 [Capsicum annuum]|uniref:PPM-type phosphatase domain-containing protein n=1 Tax=Capsicum annuum TaxID=4072 RepID=A0A2G2Z8T1_CAPAN|nr:hypothetical protein T459_16452 [Capsicum annuum]
MGSSLYPEDAFLIVGEESRLSIDVEETEMHLDVFQTLKESFLKAYKGKNLVIGNIGDSRAMLAMRGEDDSLTVVQLTVDLKPDLPAARGEKKRRVFGLGSEAKRYYGQTLCVSCGKTSSSASHEFCLAFVIFGIVDDVGFFKDSWLMFGAMEVLDIIMCLDVAMFGIVDV